MAWQPGESGNPNGKEPGTKNKKTKQWELFTDFLLGEALEEFPKRMRKLKDNEYAKTVIDLLEFFQPKLSRQTHDLSEETLKRIETIRLIETKKD